MDQFITSVGAKIIEYTVAPVAHELGYSCLHKTNVDNLKTQLQLLEGEKDRVQHSVNEATRNGEEIEADVQNWLMRVTSITKNAEDFFKHEDHTNPMCSCKLFQMLVSRHKLSKKAETMAKAADAEIKVATTILSQKVSYAVPPKGVIETKGYMTFHSRDSIFKKIMDALRNSNVSMIGVYGMGGVGKTMLAKEVARQATEEKLFDKTVMVPISQTPDVKKIQKEIAEHLGLKLDEKSISVRAERLSRRLGQETKILVVLDDVWKKLELHELGIAFGNDKKGCKILLTSRFQDVVQSEMGAEKIFLLGVLYDNEAKGLFGKIVGDLMMNNPDFQNLATDIVKECGGLPIAIETVANALKNRTSPVWKNALQELRRSVPTNIKGMHEKVYSSIKLSYNYLESDEAKLMLLFIGLYPEDYYIGFITFFICGIGLELFQGIKGLEEADNKVVTLVEGLKTTCFLSDGPRTRTVTMHDVIQDVMISIGSQEKQMFSLKNYVPELEDSNKLKDATAISLLYSTDDSQLPDRLKCPQLKFLLVLCYDLSLWRDRYSQMSNHFFEEIKDLRVLELFRLCLTTLPISFCFLQNLQSLGLYRCDLGDVAFIGELKSLKILVIGHSNIVELPKQIGQLTRLQLLRVRYCTKLEVIERNVISSLIHLEGLDFTNGFTKWDTDGVNTERRNASLIELQNLSRLSTLRIHIPDFNIVPKGLFSMKLTRYAIKIGRFHYSYDIYKMISSLNCSRTLRLELNIRRLWDDPGLEMLLKRSEDLGLYRSKGVNNLVPELDREGFRQLKCLIVAKNDDMECIINSMEQNHPCSAFLSLEILYLKKLMNLEKICHGKLSTDSFGKLRAVIVEDCDRLKNLFLFSIATQLEELNVIRCKMMTEIVIYLREHDPSIVPAEAIAKFEFPQLQSLTLESLPKLVYFFHDESEGPFTSQKEDQGPESLFNTMVAFPSLKSLALSTLNSEILWPDQLPETFKMQNLTTLKVDSCNSLKHVLSFAVAGSLVQLQHLKVRQCCAMEEVLAINYTRNSEGLDRKLLPNLKHLHLEELPNLKRFCSKSWIKVLSMERLHIDACPKLEVADLLGGLKNLESLRLSSLDIVEVPREIGQLTCLRSLTLIHCPKLGTIEPNIISSLPSLEELKFQSSFTKWETEGVIGEKSNAHLSKLKNLAHLSTLHLAVSDVNSLPKDLFSTKLKGYNINIGEHELKFKNYKNSRKLELKLDTSSLLDEHVGLRMLMKGSEELGLNGLEGLNNVVYDLDWEGFPQLKFFQFQNNVGIQYIINSMDKIHPCSAFVSLESLVLKKLVNLEKLCHGKLTDKCFGKLRKIDVSNCNRLKSLFSLSEAKILSKLKEIRVADCNMMEGIVIHEIEDDNQNISNNAANKLEFPELYSLKVKSLPKFVQVFTEMKTNGTCQNQEEELVATFPIHFFNEKVKFPKLKALTLKSIATPNTIWNCQYEGQLGDDKEHAGILSRLEGLKLSELPQLMHLWEEDYHPVGRAFHNLKALFVSRCDRLKNLVPCSVSFENLRYLRVSKCHGVENLLTPSTAKSLSQLRRMIITECRRMIQIVREHQKGSDESEGEIVFSCLQVLELDNLPSLTSFYSGSNHIMRFPNLEGVFVKSCCQMRSFCNGEVSTPELKKLILSAVKEDEYDSDDEYSIDGDDDYKDEEWDVDDKYGDRPMMKLKEGDINATIRQLSESGPVDTR